MALNDFFSDAGDRLKKIPPWGWGVISVGVLGLAYYNSSKKGGGGSSSPQTNYMVDPLAQANSVDMQNQLDNMTKDWQTNLNDLSNTLTDRITQVGQLSQESSQDLSNNLHSLQNAVDNMSNQQATPTTPTAPSIKDQLSTLQGTINKTQAQLGKNFNDTNATRNYLHQQKIALATQAGWTVDSFGHVFDQNGARVDIGPQA